jgi:hypothetical protein
MKKRVIRTFCLFMAVLLPACQFMRQQGATVIRSDASSAPVNIELARDEALAYVTSSACLANVPSDVDWQLEAGLQAEGEYYFISDDWYMIVRSANASNENSRIMIVNKDKSAVWYGYVKPDGTVITTSLMR